MSDDLDIDSLLDSVSKELEETPTPNLKAISKDNEDEIFLNSIDNFEKNQGRNRLKSKLSTKKTTDTNSVVHGGETDSSDDEENRNHEYKYNDCGKSVKHLLQTEERNSERLPSATSTWTSKHQLGLPEKKADLSKEVFIDPLFGIRIVKPLISQALIKERMSGREAISMSQVSRFLLRVNPQSDWVIAGVIVHKLSKTSQKGKPYAIWTLSDLHGDLKTVSVFLFSSAYSEMWKLSVGTVIGILNPNVFEKKDGSKDEACLSVDNYQRIMIFGQSKDLGTCKSKKKSGEQCTAFVNTNKCEVCIFHVKQEYQKCSGGRSELQANFTGRGLTALRNKVLGKNEVFYGGKSFSAIPAAKSKKLAAQDQSRINFLSGMAPLVPAVNNVKASNSPRVKSAVRLESSPAQRAKDLELLKRLGGEISTASDKLGLPKPNVVSNKPLSSEVTLEESKNTAISVIQKLRAKNAAPAEKEPIRKEPTKMELQGFGIPLLSGLGEKSVDLSSPISKKHIDRAKMNALNWVQRNGPIKAVDPNSVKDKREKKRALDVADRVETDPKKAKIQNSEFFSERFKKMMAATSKHKDLLEVHQNEEQEKYFNKLELKERMEEKMSNTFKIECKAVRCLNCKYTSFSASDLCKQEKHALKVFDSFKRFFKCGDCGHRTVTLDMIPIGGCKNCGSGRWEKTSMMKEKKVTALHSLSIRGGEQKFTNSVATNASLDLLVPE